MLGLEEDQARSVTVAYTYNTQTRAFHRFAKTSLYKNTLLAARLRAEKGILIEKYML